MQVTTGVAVGLFGLVIGSFLNVVITRVPEGRSIVRPRSACPSCGIEILSTDNIPVVSYIALRGRCRGCQAPIGIQYPLVEAGCAILWLVALWRFGFGWDFALAAVLLAALLALAVIDAQVQRLPNPIVLTTFVVGVVLMVAASVAMGEWGRFWGAAIASVVSFAVFYLIAFLGGLAFGRTAMGMGDVKLSAVLGLYLGWFGAAFVIIGFFLGFLTGALGGVVLIAIGRAERREPIPFGVYLAIGTFLALLVAGPLTSWYRSTAGL